MSLFSTLSLEKKAGPCWPCLSFYGEFRRDCLDLQVHYEYLALCCELP